MHEVDVEPAVAVVVEQADAAGRRLGNLALGGAAVVEDEIQARRFGIIDESGNDPLRADRRGGGPGQRGGRVVEHVGERLAGVGGARSERLAEASERGFCLAVGRDKGGAQGPPAARLEGAVERLSKRGVFREAGGDDWLAHHAPIVVFGVVDFSLATPVLARLVTVAGFGGEGREAVERVGVGGIDIKQSAERVGFGGGIACA